MNLALLGPELVVIALGLGLLLLDLIVPAKQRRLLGIVAALFCFALFAYLVSRMGRIGEAEQAFGGMFVQDKLAIFFKALFLLSGGIVLLMAVEWSHRSATAVTEYFVLTLFALAGMMLTASANNFAVMYVALELVTVTFYVLTSYQRASAASLEAGVKYLIFGALSSAFMVYGIALCFGVSGTLDFAVLAERSNELAGSRLFQLGMLLILGGLAFKVALFPFQVWAPDVYEGAPPPSTAFLAIGSKAAGVVLLVRLLGEVLPDLASAWSTLLMTIAAISILYGSLCAIPQRSLRRLLGYSSIANGGFVMIGISAVSTAGAAAVMFYLAAYLFTVLAAFLVVGMVVQRLERDDFEALGGLHQRSPLLAIALTLSMISLAGVPPMAGFIGKFLILASLVEQGAAAAPWIWLAVVAIAGVAVSFWYYFGVIRAIYWSEPASPPEAVVVPRMTKIALLACIVGMIYLGIFPGTVWAAAMAAVSGWRI